MKKTLGTGIVLLSSLALETEAKVNNAFYAEIEGKFTKTKEEGRLPKQITGTGLGRNLKVTIPKKFPRVTRDTYAGNLSFGWTCIIPTDGFGTLMPGLDLTGTIGKTTTKMKDSTIKIQDLTSRASRTIKVAGGKDKSRFYNVCLFTRFEHMFALAENHSLGYALKCAINECKPKGGEWTPSITPIVGLVYVFNMGGFTLKLKGEGNYNSLPGSRNMYKNYWQPSAIAQIKYAFNRDGTIRPYIQFNFTHNFKVTQKTKRKAEAFGVRLPFQAKNKTSSQMYSLKLGLEF
ncbi:MAG: hypothetical protein LBM19_04800 [Holosporales bacterium]|jgi:hypothetical protein|nr:hypothetical protein [Holosporales bacterium]